MRESYGGGCFYYSFFFLPFSLLIVHCSLYEGESEEEKNNAWNRGGFQASGIGMERMDQIWSKSTSNSLFFSGVGVAAGISPFRAALI